MIPLDIPGIPNGYIVDALTWRGGQPADAAFELLANAGCKGVVDLNNTGEELQRQARLTSAAGLIIFGAHWSGITVPTQDEIRQALIEMDVINARGPVFVHCEHGSDRTGVLCACRRIQRHHYSFPRAVKEAFFALGFRGMHELWMAEAIELFAESAK